MPAPGFNGSCSSVRRRVSAGWGDSRESLPSPIHPVNLHPTGRPAQVRCSSEAPGSDTAAITMKGKGNEFRDSVNLENRPRSPSRSEAVAGIRQRASRIFFEAADRALAVTEPSRDSRRWRRNCCGRKDLRRRTWMRNGTVSQRVFFRAHGVDK
jgi:hypothetical protein